MFGYYKVDINYSCWATDAKYTKTLNMIELTRSNYETKIRVNSSLMAEQTVYMCRDRSGFSSTRKWCWKNREEK